MSEKKKATTELLESMEKFMTAKSVVGEPMVIGDTTIIPLSDISFGMAVGATMSSKNSDGGGCGGKITPSALLILRDGSSKLISVKDRDSFSKIVDMVPDIINKFTNKDKNILEDIEKEAE